MIKALESGKLAGAAIDPANAQVGDTYDSHYLELLNHKNLLVTPHISFSSDITEITASRMMLENIKAYLAGKPINLL